MLSLEMKSTTLLNLFSIFPNSLKNMIQIRYNLRIKLEKIMKTRFFLKGQKGICPDPINYY